MLLVLNPNATVLCKDLRALLCLNIPLSVHLMDHLVLGVLVPHVLQIKHLVLALGIIQTEV